MENSPGAKAALADLHEPPADDHPNSDQMGLFVEKTSGAGADGAGAGDPGADGADGAGDPGAGGVAAGGGDQVADAGTAVPVATGKAGRPAGSRNKSTEEWRKYVLGQVASPLVTLAKLAGADRDALAQEIFAKPFANLTTKERVTLFDKRLIAAAAILPYLHQKQPLAVDLGDNSQPLAMIVVPHGASDQAEKGVFDLLRGDYSDADPDDPESADNSDT